MTKLFDATCRLRREPARYRPMPRSYANQMYRQAHR